MGVVFKNNADTTLSSAIGTSDLGITVADGSVFPTLSGSDYFYLTIEDTSGAYEVVKVTARSGNNLTVVRGQDNTNAFAFTAGALCELRVTAAGLTDATNNATVGDGTLTLAKIEDLAAQTVIGRDSAVAGAASEVGATDVLDWLGSTQGQILYRNASAWVPLSPGTAGQVLQTGGAAANPAWATGVLVTDGDKGSITVSGSGTVWTLDDATVTLAKMANLNQYSLIGRSSSGPGVPQAVATSANVFTMLGSADNAAIRSNIGLGTMATQAATAVAITGGTATGLTSLQGTMKLATNTTGTLALVDADCINFLTGNITINGGVFSQPQAFLFYSGASSRTITEGSSMTLRLGGTATTGNRTLAARTLAVGVVIGTNEIVITGNGVT